MNKDYPYLLFYMQPVDNTLTYHEYCNSYEAALPTESEYLDYHSHIGKLPLLDYASMLKNERLGLKSKYDSYKNTKFEIYSRPMDSDETYNDFIDECMINGYKLMRNKEFTVVDDSWKIKKKT